MPIACVIGVFVDA